MTSFQILQFSQSSALRWVRPSMVAEKQVFFLGCLVEGSHRGFKDTVILGFLLCSPCFTSCLSWPAALPALLLLLGLWSKLASLPQLPIRGLLTLTYNNTACWESLSDAHTATNIQGQMLELTHRFSHRSGLPSFSLNKYPLILRKKADDTFNSRYIRLYIFRCICVCELQMRDS